MTSTETLEAPPRALRRAPMRWLVAACAVTLAVVVALSVIVAMHSSTGLSARARGGEGRITASWRPVADATGYSVSVSESAAMASATVRRAGRSARSLVVAPLAAGRTYFVRVTALGGAGPTARSSGAESPVLRATTAGAAASGASAAPDAPFRHLSATDYGATGDGRTDDQAALDQAVRAAAEARLPLALPPGRYLHSGQLHLDGVVLYGSSPATTELHGTTVGDHAVVLSGASPGIADLAVSGPGAAPRTSVRSGNGVYVNRATDYLIRDVHISDVSGAGVMVEHSADGVERNNLVERTGADGMYHTEGTHDVEVAYNRTVRTGDDGISVTSYDIDTHDIVIHHNSVLDNFESRAITVNGTSGGIVIRDNHIDGGTSGVSCSSHTGWSHTQTRNVLVTGNTIRGVNHSRRDTGTIGGGAISFWNDTAGPDTGTAVRGNEILDAGLYGIYAGGGSAITAAVTDNRVFGGGTLFRSDDPSARIDLRGTTVSPVSAYPGDLVPRDIGGLDPSYRYTP